MYRLLSLGLAVILTTGAAQECNTKQNETTATLSTDVQASTIEYDGHKFICFEFYSQKSSLNRVQFMHHPSCPCAGEKKNEESYFNLW